MNQNKPYWMSVGSGCVWAVLGLTVGIILESGPGSSLRKPVLGLMGGMIVSPLIGLLMGQVSRLFPYVEGLMRIIIAGASLYAASVLFVMGSLLLQFVISGHMARDFWTTSFGAATIGFELSCVVLWPAAYVNHTLIAKAWQSRRRSIVGS
jgi:hypothetical protein